MKTFDEIWEQYKQWDAELGYFILMAAFYGGEKPEDIEQIGCDCSERTCLYKYYKKKDD